MISEYTGLFLLSVPNLRFKGLRHFVSELEFFLLAEMNYYWKEQFLKIIVPLTKLLLRWDVLIVMTHGRCLFSLVDLAGIILYVN